MPVHISNTVSEPCGSLILVLVKKEGRFAVYYIADEHVKALIDLCKEHVTECSP